ncbi:acryloyl-CoA reductase [Radiobacillus sp. PE A8.2]|uniref:NADPH:quinone oxidoreductase family protein n=1 Tax=Radiobacillus sp. PE A8.2 TaxID=3380349 RepID=UPI003890E4B7
MNSTFRAFQVNQIDEAFSANVTMLSVDDLPDTEVLIKVQYSSINYKDALATVPNSTIVKHYPFVPGIDLAGIVVESNDTRFKEGDSVIATSYEIGVSHYGGFSEYARIPADWIVPLPEGLSLQEAMIYGTAGFTAALSVHRLENNGLSPQDGKVLVTGATGGVGSMAVAMLAKLGYEVVASTGKHSAHEFLKKIGASEVIGREDVLADKIKPLDKQLWAGAVDPVGGQTLAAIVSKLKYGGGVAASGLTGGTQVPTAVFPFILRGVSLLGVDSVYCPMSLRKALWERMADDLKPVGLQHLMAGTTTLEKLPQELRRILDGNALGRTVIRL